MKDIIKRLQDKNYVRAFGLMKPEEQECFRKVGKENCCQFITKWEGPMDMDEDVFKTWDTYAINPDYQPDPEFVDLEIKLEGSFLGAKVEGHWFDEFPYSFTHLHCLPSLPNFDDFWYQDSPGCKVSGIKETAIARIRFEGKKVFARFRKS